MHLTPQEAAAALSQVEEAQTTMRHVIRAHRGHYHLWIWGIAWTAMPLLAHFKGEHMARHFVWICLPAGILSAFVGFRQASQVRLPPNVRFIGVIAATLFFAATFLFVLRPPPDMKTIYAYICLVVMQAYVIGGVWTDSYLLWLGLVVTALILVGLFLFPAVFWLWMALFGGGSLIATGFYVRHFWR